MSLLFNIIIIINNLIAHTLSKDSSLFYTLIFVLSIQSNNAILFISQSLTILYSLADVFSRVNNLYSSILCKTD